MSYAVVFKIQTIPINITTEIQKFEFNRKFKGTNPYIFQSYNQNFCEIANVYRKIYSINGELAETDMPEKVMSFDEFMKFVKNISSEPVTWVGWNCFQMDVPFLKYFYLKSGFNFKTKLFDGRKFQSFPILDLASEIYNYGIANSLILTAESFGIDCSEYVENYLEEDFLESILRAGDVDKLAEYNLCKGKILSGLFESYVKNLNGYE